MKKLLSMFLACVLLLGILPTSAWAADSVEAALGEVDIYNGGYELGYLSINGAVKKQDYTYFMYKSNDGTTKEVPAYCVNPYLKGVPQKVEPGESIKYLAEERSSDPKVVGIISNGYPHRSLGELNLDNKYQAYYATKMALWCYLLSTWDINNLKVAPGLSGSELDIGNRILAAAKDIYKRGTTYNYMLTPKMTATPDHSVAYPQNLPISPQQIVPTQTQKHKMEEGGRTLKAGSRPKADKRPSRMHKNQRPRRTNSRNSAHGIRPTR